MAYNKAEVNPTYDPSVPEIKFLAWLEIDGELQTTPTSCTINVYDEDNTLILTVAGSSSSNGVFSLSYESPDIAGDIAYFVSCAIVNAAVTYTSGSAFSYIN